ncbi:MAG TPA: NAD-dependent DNA ligase LigA [Planctomycetota bacterium]|nr:NAD-dependent DNA ligase LigA [Planctomycetota bacterium]
MAKTSPDPSRMDTEADKLAEQIRYHNEKYWVEHKPEISDIEYDQLVEKLRALQPDHPVLVELVEDKSDGFKKVQHAVPMLSIEKVFTVEDVIKWATGAGAFRSSNPEDGIVASYKVDGSSCSLIYEDGKLVRAASRGNGVLGDDITRNAKTIDDIPHSVPAFKGGRVEVRGEIYMSIASFKAALAKFEKDLAAGHVGEDERPTNPRNFCAGSIKQKDPNVTKERKLSFMAHGAFGKIAGSDGKSDYANQKALEKHGFKIAVYSHVKKPEDVQAAVSGIEAERKRLPYEIDGVVFTINKIALHAELGSTSHHPRFKLAYKFSRDRGETTVKRILWHTTRSGKVSPAMEVAPISLGGATVTLCTLHNAKTVKETGLRVGDKVLLEREVIPYFVQRVPPEPHPEGAVLPTKCDSCGSELSWDETDTNLICQNVGGCPSQLHDYLAYYVSRGVTNMMGVGEQLIAKLIEVGLVKSPADLFTLTEQKILDNLERQGETSARNIVNSIQGRKEQTLETFLVSLGVRSLGPSVASRLVSQLHTLENILNASEEDLMKVENFAETMAHTIREGLRARKPLIQELLKHVTLKVAEKVDGPLSGKSFCLTGHVEFDYDGKHYDARPDIEDLIKSKGGTIKSVSKALNYLVVGDDPGSKVEKAQKAGVSILDAKKLVEMLG